MPAALSSKHPQHLSPFNFYSPKILTQSSTPRQSQIDVSHDIYVMYHAPHDLLDNRNGTGNLEQTVKFSKTETNSVSIKTTDGVKTGSNHTWRGNLKLNFKVTDFGGVSESYQYKKILKITLVQKMQKQQCALKIWEYQVNIQLNLK